MVENEMVTEMNNLPNEIEILNKEIEEGEKKE